MHSKVFNAIPTFILDNESYISTKDAALLLKNLKNFFSTLSINIRSPLNPNNFNKLECLLSVLEINPHVVAVNETWKKPNTIGQHQKLNDYIYLSNPRQQQKRGGVAMYMKKNFIFDTCSDLCIMDEKNFESIFIDIHFENKVLTCSTIYRSPNKDTKSLNKFFQHLNQVLKKLKKTKMCTQWVI